MENKSRVLLSQENVPLLLITTQHINKRIHCTYQTLKDIYCHLS